jgi:hypothetical protein
MRVACALFESRRAEEIALNRARSGAPISRDATERQSAPPELTVAADRSSNPAPSNDESYKPDRPDSLKTVGPLARNRKFESISLQR